MLKNLNCFCFVLRKYLICPKLYHLGIAEEFLNRCLSYLLIMSQFLIYKDDVKNLYKSGIFSLCYVLQEDLLNFLVMNSDFYFSFGRVQDHLRGAFHYLELEY